MAHQRISPEHYRGTLADAVGLLVGDVVGNCFHVRYRMTSGVAAEHLLYVEPGGRTVLNRMVFRKMGINVGDMNETIRRTG